MGKQASNPPAPLLDQGVVLLLALAGGRDPGFGPVSGVLGAFFFGFLQRGL